MKPRISALLVYDRDDRLETIKLVLETLSISVVRARSCREAEKHLARIPPPEFVVTDTALPGGDWSTVLALAARLPRKVNAIVVSPVADIRLYLDVMDSGAFDFMTDSFTVPEIVYVVRHALRIAAERRKSQAPRLLPPFRNRPNQAEAD